ncbi:septum site-determining protein MinD [Synechococcus sp. R65.1]|jgi:septum site-determining protein MinD|uniref:septum site-determining protein MinD n=1 Tax=Synechococcus sp. R65.1 TaxID=2964524 RepID=UPI0039C3EE46
MGRVIVITSGKGGVGKTTLTANLGTALARLGRSVAVVDADFGLRNLDLLLGLENRVVYTALEVIAGECRLEQALVKDKRTPNLSLLPAAQTRNKTAVNPEQMRQLMEKLAGSYDYVLIDCPAGIEQGFRNAIAGATEALLVTTPEVAAVRDADRVVGLLEAAGISSIQLIVNRLRPDMVTAGQMMAVEDVVEVLAIPLVGMIPEDREVIVSTNKGEPMVLAARPSPAAQAIQRIARRLEGEVVEFPKLAGLGESFWEKAKRFLSQKVF